MNRREFLLLKTESSKPSAELSCEQLYMRCVDLAGATDQLFADLQRTLDEVEVLHVSDPSWLSCRELKPMESLLTAFRARGGRIQTETKWLKS
jgi:hypothetical protein